VGATFLAMLSVIFAVIAACASVVAFVVARPAGEAAAGHAVFAALVGYAPALSAPIFAPI
jgi:hypothetical protein